MSYPAGEILVLTKLRAIAGGIWTTSNTSQASWLLLNSGASDHYAILKEGPGGMTGYISPTTEERKYSTIIQVWQAYVNDGSSAINLQNYGEAIRNQFGAWRKLGDTTGAVIDSYCKSWTEVQERWMKGENGPRWLSQEFTIEWKEEVNVTFQE